MRKPVAISVTLAVIFFIATTAAPTTAPVFAQSEWQSAIDEYIEQAYNDMRQVMIGHDLQPAFAASTDSPKIIVLSHSFNTIYPEVVGEVLNNNSRSYDKYDVDIVANFRDATGALVSSETGYIDAETLRPGESSAFNIVSFDEELPDKATTYDLIVEDNRLVVGAPLEGDSGDNDDDDED